MTSTSNANTSGLDYFGYRVFNAGVGACWLVAKPSPNDTHPEPLVTAASAQARIAELEGDNIRLQAQVRMAVEAAQFEWSGDRQRLEARADRLADIVKLLDECIWFNPDTQNFEVNHDGSVEKARAALQQETQK